MSAPWRWLVAGVVSLFGVPFLVGLTALATLLYLPLPGSLPAPKTVAPSAASIVYDATGHVIGEFRAAAGSNVPVADSQIPQLVKDATVASEDRNFYSEGAVSVKGIIRAALADLTSGSAVQGGSTITEQYVKAVFTQGQRTVSRKVTEAVLARELAQKLTKEQILHRYLSIAYYGQDAYGVGAAAEAYFRTPIEKLNASQAATLAGLLPAPSAYDPLFNLQAGEQRRETVLTLMHQQGYLNGSDYRTAMAERLSPAQPGLTPSGPATLVYPIQETPNQYRYFLDYVRQYLEQRIGYNELYHGGLRIQTTIIPKDQAAAEATIAKQLAGTTPPLQMALAAVEPATGYVTSLVGGRDYAVSQVDVALGGCPLPEAPPVRLIVQATCQAHPNSFVGGGGSGRLAGSSFKPFTLAAALVQGIAPDAKYVGPASLQVPGCGGTCVINNDVGESGNFTLTTATWQSINTVYAQVLKQVGIKAVANMAKSLGITSASDESDFGLSYTLGTTPVSPLDMASAYATFADQGVHIPPSPVLRAVDGQGRVVFDDSQPKGTRVLTAEVANTVNSILQGVIQHGTGSNAMIGRPAAGKTGTTNGPTDAWFVGYTPQLSAAVWMGYSNNENTPMLDVKGVQVYGNTYPAMAWNDFMRTVLAGVPALDFTAPPPLNVPPNVLQGLQPGTAMTPAPLSGGSTALTIPPPVAQSPPTTPFAVPPTTVPPTTFPPFTVPTTTPTTLFPAPTTTPTTLYPDPGSTPPTTPFIP